MKGGELRGSEHLIEGKGEARQVASRVDLVSEEFLKLAVRGRCLHDVGHFVSEQLELEAGADITAEERRQEEEQEKEGEGAMPA